MNNKNSNFKSRMSPIPSSSLILKDTSSCGSTSNASSLCEHISNDSLITEKSNKNILSKNKCLANEVFGLHPDEPVLSSIDRVLDIFGIKNLQEIYTNYDINELFGPKINFSTNSFKPSSMNTAPNTSRHSENVANLQQSKSNLTDQNVIKKNSIEKIQKERSSQMVKSIKSNSTEKSIQNESKATRSINKEPTCQIKNKSDFSVNNTSKSTEISRKSSKSPESIFPLNSTRNPIQSSNVRRKSYSLKDSFINVQQSNRNSINSGSKIKIKLNSPNAEKFPTQNSKITEKSEFLNEIQYDLANEQNNFNNQSTYDIEDDPEDIKIKREKWSYTSPYAHSSILEDDLFKQNNNKPILDSHQSNKLNENTKTSQNSKYDELLFPKNQYTNSISLKSELKKTILFSGKKVHTDGKLEKPKIIKTEWAMSRINKFDDGSSTFEIMEPTDEQPINNSINSMNKSSVMFAVLPNRTTVCYVPL